jgi:hypothetical protein
VFFRAPKYPNKIIAKRPTYDCGNVAQTCADMHFIAHSRQDLPDCLAEITRLKGILARAMPCLDDRFKDLRNEIWEAIQ